MGSTSKKFLSSFGRNRGRTLRPYQQGLVDELLPKLAPNFSELARIAKHDDTHIAVPPPLGGRLGRGRCETKIVPNMAPPQPSPYEGEGIATVMPSSQEYSKLALEIGFGGGEHLLAQAAHNPDTLFIGCEPYINGVAKCLSGIDEQKLKNIRLFTRDARELIEALPDACLDSVFILFPDPWPKLRHNKRRLVNAETLNMLARTHKKGGRLLLATDHVDYSVWMLELLQNHPDYTWTAREQADWQTPPKDWTTTKYQRKTTEQGREPLFMECVRG